MLLITTPTRESLTFFAPLGKGQRGLIVAQPKTGKTTILRQDSQCSIHEQSWILKSSILLIDERPEGSH